MKRVLKGVFLLLVVSMLFSLCVVSAFAADAQRITVTSETAPVYERANVTSEKIATANSGFTFTPIGSTKSFWHFQFKKKNDDKVYSGYILKSDTNNPTAQAANETVAQSQAEASQASAAPSSPKTYKSLDKAVEDAIAKANSQPLGPIASKIHPDKRTGEDILLAAAEGIRFVKSGRNAGDWIKLGGNPIDTMYQNVRDRATFGSGGMNVKTGVSYEYCTWEKLVERYGYERASKSTRKETKFSDYGYFSWEVPAEEGYVPWG